MIFDKSEQIKRLKAENNLLKELLQFYISLNKLTVMKQDLKNQVRASKQNYIIPINLN